MNRLQHWHCGEIMHDILLNVKKGSWCVPLSKAYIVSSTLRSVSLATQLKHIGNQMAMESQTLCLRGNTHVNMQQT